MNNLPDTSHHATEAGWKTGRRSVMLVGMKIPMLAVLIVASCGLATPAAAQNDTTQVLAVVQRMFDAMRSKDTSALRSLWIPGGKLWGLRTRQDGSTVLQQTTEQQFAEAVARDTRGVWDERTFNPEVRLDGNMATVWVAYDFWLGPQFSHCGVDSFQMLKTAEGWKVVNVVDTFQRTGCPQRPAR